MALVYADRVKETSTTTGTGTYDLAGAATGFQGFVAGIGSTNTCYYCATDGTDWEVGLGTVTDAATDTLARTIILASTNANAAVNWAAGTRDVFVTIPGSQMVSPSIPSTITIPNTGLHLLDTNASHDLIIAPGSDLTADRTLTVTTGDANRTLTLSGDTTLSGGTHSGTNTGDQTSLGAITGGNWKVLYTNGSGVFTELALGAANTVLTSAGASSAPTFSTPSGGMTLLATLTTTSGTTQSATGLAASTYRKYYIEVDGVSFTTAVALTVAISGNNGSNYGTAVTISPALAAGTQTLNGAFEIGNINGTSRFASTLISGSIQNSNGASGLALATLLLGKNNTGATGAVDAIQFAGGTFDAGEIRIYGVG